MAIATCHPTKVSKGHGLCGACYDKWLKSINPEYKKKQAENTSEWLRRNPAKKRATYLRRRAKERANPLIRRASFLRVKYGLSLENYAEMLRVQNGGCAICDRKPGRIPLHVDHDHKTNKIRGLLCHQCNWYLGTLESDPTVLDRLLSYLRNNGVVA